MTTTKRGRGRPKGAPNKPKMELVTERINLPNGADVYEILCQANIVAETDVPTAVNGLKIFNDRNAAVSKVLRWLFDSNINSTLPEGETPFNKNDAPDSSLTETALRFEFKKFQYFVTEQIPVARRETMWIEMLEGMHPKEAQMIDLIKDKKNPFPNLTKEIASEAFPEIQV